MICWTWLYGTAHYTLITLIVNHMNNYRILLGPFLTAQSCCQLVDLHAEDLLQPIEVETLPSPFVI